jgi:hypothetical protein
VLVTNGHPHNHKWCTSTSLGRNDPVLLKTRYRPYCMHQVRGIIPFTCDMYVCLRITQQATSLATHDDANCIDLDRSMRHEISLGCVEDVFTSFLPQNEQKLLRCVNANSRACQLFYLTPT